MKKISLVFAVLFLAVLLGALCKIALADYADFDSDFSNASKMRGNESVNGTDDLVKGTTGVLHKENMAILSEIDKLHKEIADLKKEIKDLKDAVEGER